MGRRKGGEAYGVSTGEIRGDVGMADGKGRGREGCHGSWGMMSDPTVVR